MTAGETALSTLVPSPCTLSALVVALHERNQPSRAMQALRAGAESPSFLDAMAKEDANRW